MKKSLGRGLEALFSENSEDIGGKSEERLLRISEIEPNRGQPRRDFDEERLQELALSIKSVGIIQPIVVRPIPGGRYQIVSGERRWRAARLAGLSEVPAIVREYDDRSAMEAALIENLQREDLNPIEEAEGFRRLLAEYNLTQEEAAERVGKSRPAVANALRLLSLPDEVQQMVRVGQLSQGHARCLLALEDRSMILDLAKKAAASGVSVRQLENEVARIKKGRAREKGIREANIYAEELGKRLSSALGRKVSVRFTGKKGKVEIEYYDVEDLDRLVALLEKGVS